MGSSPNLKYKWGDLNCKKAKTFPLYGLLFIFGSILVINLWAETECLGVKMSSTIKWGYHICHWIAVKIKWEYTRVQEHGKHLKTIIIIMFFNICYQEKKKRGLLS